MGFGGFASDLVTNGNIFDSIDLIFGGQSKTAVGFDLISTTAGAMLDVRVYDINNLLIGLGQFAGDPSGLDYLGVQATDGDIIGRINIFDPNHVGLSGIDNVEMWEADGVFVPVPPAMWMGSLGVIAVIVLRRKIL